MPPITSRRAGHAPPRFTPLKKPARPVASLLGLVSKRSNSCTQIMSVLISWIARATMPKAMMPVTPEKAHRGPPTD